MFAKKPVEKTGLEIAIDRLLNELEDHTAESEDYATMVDQLAKLHKLKEDEKPSRVSPDTLISVGGSLTGILLIVMYEQKNVLGSKALNFAQKLL